ncbi:DUF402 domain-containing protein [Salinicoccus sp. ID82-1]|nr:DUF402 domain-containing protein [Salinicoccus sp. ID82-1]
MNIDIHPNGNLEYYCNIALPPEYEDGNVSFIDLDVDIVKIPGEDWKMVDYDEFIVNSRLLNYPEDIFQFVEHSVDKLKSRIEKQSFPFDGFFDAYIDEIIINQSTSEGRQL